MIQFLIFNLRNYHMTNILSVASYQSILLCRISCCHSGTSLLISDMYTHAVVLFNFVFTLLGIGSRLEAFGYPVNSAAVCGRAPSRHTLLSRAVDHLAFDYHKVLPLTDGSVRAKVAVGIDAQGIVQALSNLPNPCLCDIRYQLPLSTFAILGLRR